MCQFHMAITNTFTSISRNIVLVIQIQDADRRKTHIIEKCTFIQALPQCHLLNLTVAVKLESAACLRPVVTKSLDAQSPAFRRHRLVAAMQFGRVHADLVDLRHLIDSARSRSGSLTSRRQEALPHRVSRQKWSASTLLQAIDYLVV